MKVKLYFLRSRSFLLITLFAIQSIVSFSQQVAKSIPYPASPDGLIGFLQFTPPDYGSQRHPLIIFLHGIGERGNGTSQLNIVANNGIPLYCRMGASMRFTVGGQTSSFVVLSPQLSTQYGYWPTFYVKEMINYAKANLQIDPNRIYITGLSLGGGGIWRVITDTYNFDHTFDASVAAAAPVCGTQEENDADYCSTIGANNLPIWAFHSMDDGTVGVGATQHAEILSNNCPTTPRAKFTYYQSGGHGGAWVNAYDTGHITRTVVVNGVAQSFTATPNLYEWFLGFSRNAAPVNTPPTANAGAAQIITLPTNTVTLNGSGAGTNGASIVSYSWAKTSGPAGGAISVPLANSTLVTGLVQGTYVFTLTVTDNHGLSATSTVSVTVNPLVNQLPVANAGNNITLTLPANNTTLNGTGSRDPDGTIATYAWTKTSGPSSYTIANPAAASTALSNLTQGVYVFTLQVTDNAGGTASSTVTVTVNAPANQKPVANAGSNISITLPVNNTTLNGTASADPDGTIASYAWTKTSGPASYSIANAGAASTALSNLVQGVYQFRLQVTDNAGATDTALVTVTVNAAANQPPVANAGSNISITLPTNNITLNGTVSADPDGTISTYAWTKTSGPATYTIANAGAASTAVTGLVQGVYIFTLQVTDNAGASSSSFVTVTVNAAPAPANQSPIASAGSNVNITLPLNSATLNGSASFDPDGSIASYAWSKTSGPSSYSFANATAYTTTVNNLVAGVYVFTLQVTDNAGATSSATVTVTVNNLPAPPNQSPIADAGSNSTITLPVNSATVNASASFDPDGSIASYAWSKTSGPAQYAITDASAYTTTVTNLVQGVYVFTVTITDNSGATATANVNVTVNAPAPPPPVPNQVPVARAGAAISITLPTDNAVLDGTASSDADGNIVSYAWTKTSGPAGHAFANAAAASTNVSNLVAGTYVFTLQVTDNAGATASADVTVAVNPAAVATPPVTTPPPPPPPVSPATPVNKAPVANAGNNVDITLPTNSTSLNGSGSYDTDGSIAGYKWTKTSGPAAYSIDNATGASTTINNLTEGVYVFTLEVTDNAGASASAAVTVTVHPAPNQAPVANAGADIVLMLPENTTALDGSASYDADGSIVTYSWNKVSGPGAITIVNSNTASPSVIGLSEGQYSFELTVTDNKGSITKDQVLVTVQPAPNKAPTAKAGADTSIALPASSAVLTGISSSDEDGTIAGYAWKQVSGPATAVITNNTAAVTPVTGLVEGEYVFELKVTDNSGASATVRVKVSVTNNFRYSQYFKLYPNPASNSINFQYIDDKTGKLRVIAYDVNGRLVVEQEFSKEQSLITKELNISHLKAGMYYLEIRQADGQKLIRPFVKQ
ncbi:MAG TPA: PKD domain-containing protein [Chitinophagaceae bacterium]|nr:PKD domain-containing protein [Chitinophagaceae bacterium]